VEVETATCEHYLDMIWPHDTYRYVSLQRKFVNKEVILYEGSVNYTHNNNGRSWEWKLYIIPVCIAPRQPDEFLLFKNVIKFPRTLTDFEN